MSARAKVDDGKFVTCEITLFEFLTMGPNWRKYPVRFAPTYLLKLQTKWIGQFRGDSGARTSPAAPVNGSAGRLTRMSRPQLKASAHALKREHNARLNAQPLSLLKLQLATLDVSTVSDGPGAEKRAQARAIIFARHWPPKPPNGRAFGRMGQHQQVNDLPSRAASGGAC